MCHWKVFLAEFVSVIFCICTSVENSLISVHECWIRSELFSLRLLYRCMFHVNISFSQEPVTRLAKQGFPQLVILNFEVVILKISVLVYLAVRYATFTATGAPASQTKTSGRYDSSPDSIEKSINLTSLIFGQHTSFKLDRKKVCLFTLSAITNSGLLEMNP